MTAQREVATDALRMDYFRRSPAAVGGPGGHKEWHHFCVLAAGVDVIANFSFSDDTRPSATPGAEIARLTMLTRAGGVWDGDVETFPPESVRAVGGGISVRLGRNLLEFRDGAYEIHVELSQRPIAADVRLEPVTAPAFAPNVPLPDGPPLHWVLIPRLRASGTVTIGSHTTRLDDAMAYHDHNWGHFLWGQRFSWIWGFALPADPSSPWSLTFVRLMDRARTSALAQGLFLWRGGAQCRVFRDRDIELTTDVRTMRDRRVLKVPRVMGLLAPDSRSDVPRSVTMHARDGRDELTWRFSGEDVVQVVIPSETDMSVTIINEVNGTLNLDGAVAGERVRMEGRAVCEFLGC